MKMLVLIAILTCFACSGKQNIRDFIPGPYTRHTQNEYSEGYDTLFISHVNNDANAYTILRSATFQRVINGEKKPADHKTEKWIAIYDEKNNVLIEQKKGKIISFTPNKNQLLVGSSVYQKIK